MQTRHYITAMIGYKCSKGTQHTFFLGGSNMLEMFKIIMVMIDECGSEVVVNTFSISSELDSDYLEVWEGMKMEEARERYPEAMGFYFEDSRDLQRLVDEDVYSEVNGLKDARDDDEEWEA